MRRSVALLTCWFELMLTVVALGTCHLGMTTGRRTQLADDFAVAGVAGFCRGNILVPVNLQRLVNLMTLGTGICCLVGIVWFMAGRTFRNKTMAGVAARTVEFAMLARKLGQLLLWTGMALGAVVCQARPHCNLFRSVGVGVTGGAVGKNLAVGHIVATGAFRHQRFVVPLFRVVSVNDRVAFLAIELVSGAITAEVFVVT